MTTTRRGMLSGAAGLGVAACATPAARTAAASDALGDKDAVGVAAAIRSGEITAADAIEAAIARCERANAQLNFVATDMFAQARAAQPAAGPFSGVPTLLKDLLATAGVRTMFGSRALANYVPARQPPLTDAIAAAGFVSIAKSTTPEFGFTATTEPLVTGATRNPWNVAHSCGGSSGGAGAAVAAGVVPLAHASDGGGSIRIPASCNGLVGLKPSRGRVIRADPEDEPLVISVNGCVSRTVRDTAAFLAAVERTGEGAAVPPLGLVEGPSTRRLRIGLAVDAATGAAPDAEVAEATQAAAELCRRLGHQVRDVRLPFDGQAFSDAFILYWASGAAQVKQQVMANANGAPPESLLEPLSLDLAAMYEAAPAGALNEALGVLIGAGAQYDAMFAEFDVLLTPTLAEPPLRIGDLSPTLPFDANQNAVMNYVAYTPLQNVAGAPAISLPLAWSAGGLPIGAHFSTRVGDERTLLELAYELEAAQPWAQRKPAVWVGA
ncbi:MAG: amidase [Alphaproteobacteria bacterium]|nr:amidase [Alphaproteobacteria bacterium]